MKFDEQRFTGATYLNHFMEDENTFYGYKELDLDGFGNEGRSPDGSWEISIL